MESLLEGDFDLVETFENLDRYARAEIEEGNTFNYDGNTYEVVDYEADNGEYTIAGREVG